MPGLSYFGFCCVSIISPRELLWLTHWSIECGVTIDRLDYAHFLDRAHLSLPKCVAVLDLCIILFAFRMRLHDITTVRNFNTIHCFVFGPLVWYWFQVEQPANSDLWSGVPWIGATRNGVIHLLSLDCMSTRRHMLGVDHFICILFITIDHSVAYRFHLSSYRVMPLALKFLPHSVWYWLVEDPFGPRFRQLCERVYRCHFRIPSHWMVLSIVHILYQACLYIKCFVKRVYLLC